MQSKDVLINFEYEFKVYYQFKSIRTEIKCFTINC